MELGEILILVFTGVVAGSTVAYALLTWRLVTETRRMREVQTEPRVSVGVDTDHTGHPGYELVVQNNGHGVAKNVRFEFEGDPSYFRSTWVNRSPPQVNELPLFKDGLDYLEPGQAYRFPLGTVSKDEFERAIQAPWTFRARYESILGTPKVDTYIVDFSLFRGMFFDRNHLREISEHMKHMRDDLRRMTDGYAKVQVDVHRDNPAKEQNEPPDWQSA